MSAQFRFFTEIFPKSLIFIALSACAGGSGLGQNSATGGGPVGAPTQAVPGMEEVAVGPGIDPHGIKLMLQCQALLPEAHLADKDGEADVGEADSGATSLQNAEFTLKLNLPYVSGVPLRAVDETSHQYRQAVTDSNGNAYLKWNRQSPQSVSFYSAMQAGNEANAEPKACDSVACADPGMKKLTPCLRGISCQSYGFSYPICETQDPAI